MTRPDWKSGTAGSAVDWAGLIKIVAVQAVVLLALAAAAITYVNWASEAAMAEFVRNSEPTLSAAASCAAEAGGERSQAAVRTSVAL